MEKPEYMLNLTIQPLKFEESMGFEESITYKCGIAVAENFDEAVHREIIDIAKEEGLNSLFLLNKKDIASALKKQIPKKPINKTKCDCTIAKLYENCNIVVCPCCGGRLKLKSKGKYCDKCGQALDWSDTE